METEQAIDLVFKQPEFIYKYSSASRAAQIIGDLTFYFAPVAQLNDLFEFRARSLYTETPESKYRVVARRLVNDRWFASFDEAFEAARSGGLESTTDETYAAFLSQLNFQLQNIMQHSGVTCFSSHSNNQRMWGTYGDSHAGAVIEFSTALENSKFAAHLMPVLYLKQRFPLCPSHFMTESFTLNLTLCGALCCVKHFHWMEEFEWRLVLLADHDQSKQDRIVPFERSAISRVFLGPRISPENEELIRKHAARHQPEIPVFKRKIDDAEAKEEVVGVEHITSFEQLKYWAERCSKKQPPGSLRI